MQTDLFEVHRFDNNPESQIQLDENRSHFNGQCLIVYSLLMQDVVLTSYDAMVKFGIGHLARRVLDLKEKGVRIDEAWDYDVKPKCKRWYFSKETKEYNKNKFNA